MKKQNWFFVVAVMIAVMVMGAGTGYAQTTWDGDTDDDWNNALNWTDGIPDAADAVTIESGMLNDPTLSVGALCNTLTINTTGEAVTLALGANTLTLTLGTITATGDDAATITGANLTLPAVTTTITNSSTGKLTLDGIIGTGTSLVKFAGTMDIDVTGVITGATVPVELAMTALAAVVTFSGTNTYAGVTTITSGMLTTSGGGNIDDASHVNLAGASDTAGLTLGAAETIGDLSGNGDITLAANDLTVLQIGDTTYAGNLGQGGGGGGLIKQGDGTLTLSGTSLYAGKTTVSTGTLKLTNTSAYGVNLGVDGIILAAGTALDVSVTIASEAWDPGITLSGAATINFSAADTEIDQNIACGGNTLTITGNQPSKISGNITGTNALTVNMTALSDVVTLSGTNTYAGLTTITLGDLTLSGGAAINDLGAVTLAATANAILTLSASEKINTLTGGAGCKIVLGGNTLTVDQDATAAMAGVISGAGGLTLAAGSTGTLKLTGAQTYTGTTTISAGTLLYNEVMDNLCNGAITVASGATIGGAAGTIKGAVTVQDGGIVKPGDAGIGTLTTSTHVIFQGASELVVDNVNGTFDVLAVGGDLTLPAGTSLIKLEAGQSYTTSNAVVTIVGSYNSANEFSTASLPAGWGIISTTDTDIKLTYSTPAIPTLNEWGMIITFLLLAGAGFMMMRRRKSGSLA